MKIKLDNGALLPTKAHNDDAGFDLYSKSNVIIPGNGSAIFDTGVHIELPKGTVGFVKSRSGLHIKHGITTDGVIDCGYTGSIKVRLTNNTKYNYKVVVGDKIAQLVIAQLATIDELCVVDELESTDRGNNGFGSSGR